MKYAVQDKVRPYAEIVEVTDEGLTTAVVVYGETAKEAQARAELLAEYMHLEATPEYVRKRLRWGIRYHWAMQMAKQRKARTGREFTVYHLIAWLLAAKIDPRGTREQLQASWGGRAPGAARVMGAEEATDDD